MVFSTGYQANLGMISTIAGKGDYIILDVDSHASIWDGCKMGNAEIVPFRHNDVDALEKRLGRIPEGAGKLVVLEGVYSMLGDIAPLQGDGRGRQEARRDGAGRRGALDGLHRPQRPRRRRGPGRARRGRFRHRHLFQDRSARSAASASRTIPKFEVLRLVCRPYVFTASLPPSVVATAATSIRKLMHARRQARAAVGELAPAARQRCTALGFTARHRNAAKRDHRGDHARSGTRRGDVAGAAARGALRQSGAPAGDARRA